ncbi:MAG: gliding motility-associated ABC transporter ATP-binding subunit GldA [Bacteroidia bacterium]
MSIEVNELTKIYGTQKAVNNISFSLKPGEILGFLGPNGAGKSTTMKIITGYIPPTSGNAIVCGSNVEENPVEVKKNIGYLPELNPLYADMFVKEYLLFIADTYGIKGAEANSTVENMITRTGLIPERNKKINQLSKGYKQRVGLAAAMLHNPQVLILDEPTSGLDPNQVVEIRSLIKEIGKDKTVILSTHIMQEVKAMCSRVIIINKGSIVADDSIENIQNHLNQSYKINIEVKGNANLGSLQKINNVLQVEPTNNGFKVTASSDVREELAKLSVAEGWLILSMSLEEGNLEEIFQQLTKA